MNGRTPAEVLAEARRRDSQKKRTRVMEAVDQMVGNGESVTFAAVARAAQVSTWLVYAPGMREHIEAARVRQTQREQRRRSDVTTSSVRSLKTDIELLRQENAALRRERDKLKNALRRQFGQQLDYAAVADVASRAQELSARNQELATANERLMQDNADLLYRLSETEDDLAASRESLRKMIRSEN
jgi:regulator of replication initiation timing